MSLLLFLLYVVCVSCESYYEILGVKQNAKDSEIKKAFRRLSLQLHPDKAPKEERSKFLKVKQAYTTLMDPDTRLLYDTYGDALAKGDQAIMKSVNKKVHSTIELFKSEPLVHNFRDGDEYQLSGVLEKPWIILFYTPWTTSTHSSLPEWKRTARLLEGIAHVGACNCAANIRFCRQYQAGNVHIKSTVLLMMPEEDFVEEYEGTMTADGLASFVKNSMSGVRDLEIVTSENYESKVINSNDFWLLTFCSNSSTICVNLYPHLRRMASSLKNWGKVGVVYCKNEQDGMMEWFCENHIQGPNVPSMRAYRRGSEKGGGEDVPLRISRQMQTMDFLNVIETVLRLSAPVQNNNDGRRRSNDDEL